MAFLSAPLFFTAFLKSKFKPKQHFHPQDKCGSMTAAQSLSSAWLYIFPCRALLKHPTLLNVLIHQTLTEKFSSQHQTQILSSKWQTKEQQQWVCLQMLTKTGKERIELYNLIHSSIVSVAQDITHSWSGPYAKCIDKEQSTIKTRHLQKYLNLFLC